MTTHHHRVPIYYEDTDFSGVVYHANYLKYFERAREEMLGVDRLVRLYRESGIGFVVYKISDLLFLEGAAHGDVLDIRTSVYAQSEYRAVFHQSAFLGSKTKPIVSGTIHLACVDRAKKLVKLPADIIATMPRSLD